jgi:hypothetical protein
MVGVFSLSRGVYMRIWILALGLVVLLPPLAGAEVWDFSCTEAVSILKSAQDRVVQKHDQLQEAKFSLRHAPQEFDGCRRSRRGFDGGKIHCVKHQSRHGNLLKDIHVAQRSLDAARQDFVRHMQSVLRSCPVSQP